MSYSLIDIGANLAHDSFDDDRDLVVERAVAAGVQRIVVTGSSDESNVRAAELAGSMPGVLYSTAGVHPHHASEYSEASDALIRRLVSSEAVVAVGECGLDYFRNFSPREAQLEAFRRQLEIAKDCGLPVFLHQRDAHDDFVELVEPALPGLSRAVAHCFTGEGESLREYVAMDLYIGITGWICDERRGAHLKEIVPIIPDDRLLIESDAPYLMPRSLRPKPKSRRNEPAYLPEVLRTIAAARSQSEEHVARISTENAETVFRPARHTGNAATLPALRSLRRQRGLLNELPMRLERLDFELGRFLVGLNKLIDQVVERTDKTGHALGKLGAIQEHNAPGHRNAANDLPECRDAVVQHGLRIRKRIASLIADDGPVLHLVAAEHRALHVLQVDDQNPL